MSAHMKGNLISFRVMVKMLSLRQHSIFVQPNKSRLLTFKFKKFQKDADTEII